MLNRKKKLSINCAGSWERLCRNIYQRVDLSMEARKARKSCKRQLKTLGGGLKASKYLYRTEVLPFWSRYGIKPKKMWYDLYCYKDKRYDPRYIPEDIYWKVIYPTYNKTDFRHAYTDKCFYKQLFPYLKQPRTILRNSNSIFYDESGNIVSFLEAQSILQSEENFVIKPAIYSGEGVDIFFYNKEKYKEMDFASLMNLYKRNYIVQEIASQHESLEDIHPNSLNTIRIISFLFQGQVHISSAILRMGVGGSRLDNVSAGGIACPILPSGRLGERGINRKSQWLTSHPGGKIFSEIEIPSYQLLLETIDRAHKKVPHFRIIGWDFSIDKEEEPVLIEYNGAPGLNQVSCGPLFGHLTEEVLDEIFLNKSKSSTYIIGEFLSMKEKIT